MLQTNKSWKSKMRSKQRQLNVKSYDNYLRSDNDHHMRKMTTIDAILMYGYQRQPRLDLSDQLRACGIASTDVIRLGSKNEIP